MFDLITRQPKTPMFDIFGDLFGSGGGNIEDVLRQSTTDAIATIRRQQEQARTDFLPFLQAGQEAIPGFVQGTTPGGFDEILGEIFNQPSTNELIERRQRSVSGQLASGGLTRSGLGLEEAARVPTDVGLGIESTLSNRLGSLLGLGQGAAAGVNQLGAGASGNIANLITGQGSSLANLFAAQETRDRDAQGQGLGLLGSLGGSLISAFGPAIIGAFSDPRLKENVEQVGQIADLALYQWDWREETKGTMIEVSPRVGFMADEVKKKYPQHVFDFGGFDCIAYSDLLNELDFKNDPQLIEVN